MKTQNLCRWAGLGLLTLALAVPAFAGGEPGARGFGLRDVASGDWKRVTPGVWTRQAEDGATETYALGARGMKWALVSTQRELAKVMELYQREPSSERWQQIERLLGTIRKLEAATRNEGQDSPEIQEKAAAPAPPPCAYDYLHANAYSLSNGVAANADAVWCHADYYYPADVYARAYAQVTASGVKTEATQTCAHSGVVASCVVAASVPGNGYCTSEAYSSIFVFIPGHNLFYERSAYRCGCNPFVACAIEVPADVR